MVPLGHNELSNGDFSWILNLPTWPMADFPITRDFESAQANGVQRKYIPLKSQIQKHLLYKMHPDF